MKTNLHSLLGAAAFLGFFTVGVVHAQIDIGEPPGSEIHHIYDPREPGEFPDDAIDTGDLQLVYYDEGREGAAYLHSVTGEEASVTWHYRLTDSGAVWGGDARMRTMTGRSSLWPA